ncbi:50S ribosomal protein L18 [Patescibacteria group bacterium]|nr:50S ribosomal protein L18 [Patescibacteria group bacterium]
MGKVNLNKKIAKKRRISSHIRGISTKPRISVFRSNRFIYAQAVDDEKKITLVSSSSVKMSKSKKVDQAKQVGLALAKLLKEKKIDTVVFDRNVYVYKGRVKALAEGLREGGIKV